MELQQGTVLQTDKYTIVRQLGKGGFGITYLATWSTDVQGALGAVRMHTQVVIKEFFLGNYCDRNTTTNHVTSTESGKDLVMRFKDKFIKEARLLSTFNHPNIIRVYDVFEENNTAYYVMEYIDGGSLTDLVNKSGVLSEQSAVEYVRQLGDALNYLHQQKTLHLDVKPANVLLRPNGQVVLIDFGVSKRYDEQGGQTSTTPVGISKGYAPIEQYTQGGVSQFSPATDIYSMAASFFFLVTGKVPPEAADLAVAGVPKLPNLSEVSNLRIRTAMHFVKDARPQSVTAFWNIGNGGEDTKLYVDTKHEEKRTEVPTPSPEPPPPPKPKQGSVVSSKPGTKPYLIWIGLFVAVLIGVVIYSMLFSGVNGDVRTYNSLIEEAQSTKDLSKRLSLYQEAAAFEAKYKGTDKSSEFRKKATENCTIVSYEIQKIADECISNILTFRELGDENGEKQAQYWLQKLKSLRNDHGSLIERDTLAIYYDNGVVADSVAF